MINLSRFYLRQGNLSQAEHHMRDAYSYDIKNNPFALSYASLLIQCNRTDEAIVILRELSAKGFETVKVNILISLAYRMAD
mmetsp:Transcript_24781/g.17485  ORF Transcript_24781/g.17485 Transcript_24781/m.17485 type:complete len:81 (-) Transcript_24781:1255-1497(-)